MTTNFLVVGGTGKTGRGVPPFDRGTWAGALDIRAFAELAVASGVRRLVLLSGRGDEEAEACEGTAWAADMAVKAPTGPRPLSVTDAAAGIAAASGRDVRCVPDSGGEFAAGQGVPAAEAGALTELFARAAAATGVWTR
jgi:hypothetical protein